MSAESKIFPSDQYAMRTELDFLRAGSQAARAALRNRAFSTGGPNLPIAPTTGSPLFVAGAVATAKTSGIFWASIDAYFIGGTATDTFEWTVTTQTRPLATPFALTNQIGNGVNTFVSTAAAGILVTGGPFASLTQIDSGAQILGTAATTGQFSWSAIIQNSVTAFVETPFTIGNQVLLLLALNRGAGSNTFTGLSINLVEQP